MNYLIVSIIIIIIIFLIILRSNKPLKFGSREALTISPHDLSLNQSGAGLACGFSKATPPVNRKRHIVSSTRPLIKLKENNFGIQIKHVLL